MEQFGRYRIEALIGTGATGEVYRAHDEQRDRVVALKVLPDFLSEDADYREQFGEECNAVARLREPHVIPIQDFGEIDGRLYVDMRLVDGRNLDELLTEVGRLAPDRTIGLLGQASEALDAAHGAGLLHRAVRPSNLLVDRSDFVYVVDFGVGYPRSRLSVVGTTVGSLDYVAPERFESRPADARSDIYSLTCVLHECLTGTRPFPGDDLPALMYGHLYLPPPRPSEIVPELPAAIDDVIARGMAKDPAQRYGTARELAVAAHAALGLSAAGSDRRAANVAGPAAARPGRPGPVVAAAAPVPVPVPAPADEREPEPATSRIDSPAAMAPAATARTEALPPVDMAKPEGATTRTERHPVEAAEVDGATTSTERHPVEAAEVDGATTSTERHPVEAAEVDGATTRTERRPVEISEVEGATTRTERRPEEASEPEEAPTRAVAPAQRSAPAWAAARAQAPAPRPAPDREPRPAPETVPVPVGAGAGQFRGGDAPGRFGGDPPDWPDRGPAGAGPPPPPLPDAPRSDDDRPRRRRGLLPLILLALLLVVASAGVTLVVVNRSSAGDPTAQAPAPQAAPSPGPGVPVAPGAPVPVGAAPEPVGNSSASPTAGATVPVGPTPGYMEIAPNGRYGYIANRAAGILTVFDTTINAVTGTIPVPDGGPQFVVFSPDGTRAYVSIFNSDFSVNELGVLDTANSTFVAKVPTGKRPFALDITPDGKTVYVPNHDSSSITVVDTATNTVKTTITVAPNPHWVDVSTDGKRLYAANHESNLVTILDTATNEPIATVPVGKSPHSILANPKQPLLYNVNYDDSTMSVTDLTTNAVIATVPTGPHPQDVSISADGKHGYLATVDDNAIQVFDTKTFAITARVPVGRSPTSIAVAPNGRQAYVTNLDDGTVTVINIAGTA